MTSEPPLIALSESEIVDEQVQLKQLSRQETANKICQYWNEFAEKHGSFADEHSTL
jgi:Post-segregation antitoxin CcdA